MDVILFLFIAVYNGLGRKGRIKSIKKEKKVFFTFSTLLHFLWRVSTKDLCILKNNSTFAGRNKKT